MSNFLVNSEYYQIVQKKPALKQFFKFGIIGVSNTLIDFLIYTALTRFFLFWRQHYLWANLISFSLAVLNSFYWNKKWTFKNSDKNIGGQFTRFYVVNFIALGINETLLYFFVSHLRFYDLLAKAVVVVIVMFFSFTFSKFWAFRESNKNGL